MSLSRRWMISMFAAGVLAGGIGAASSAMAQQRDPGAPGPVDGHITIEAKGAAVGVGYTWGDGTLMFHGKRHPFSVNGITIADVGFSRVVGHGRVYKLHKLSDFSGTYFALTGQATVGHGVQGQFLQNANGVQIRIDDVTKGARLTGAAGGIELTLK